MNTPNNKRKRASRERMESVFIELLQTQELEEITVSDICKRAGLNRSTFYANYTDLHDLADSIRDKLECNVSELNKGDITRGLDNHTFLKLFRHIQENQIFYKTYFKLGFDTDFKILGYDTEMAQRHFQNRFVDYHMTFFRSGLTSVLKLWLENGCKETPEEIQEILRSEYQGRLEQLARKD